MSGDQGGGVGGDTCGREIKVEQQHAAQMEELWVTERKDGGDNGVCSVTPRCLHSFLGGWGAAEQGLLTTFCPTFILSLDWPINWRPLR